MLDCRTIVLYCDTKHYKGLSCHQFPVVHHTLPNDTDNDNNDNINEGWKIRQRQAKHIVETPSSRHDVADMDESKELQPDATPTIPLPSHPTDSLSVSPSTTATITTTLLAFNGENSPLRMAMKRVMASSVHDISLTHVASEIDQHWPRSTHAPRYQEPPLPLQLQTTPSSSISSPTSPSKRSAVSVGSASVQPHHTAQPQQQSSLLSLSTPLSSSIPTSGGSNSDATVIHHYHHDDYQISSSSSDSLLGKPRGVNA
jgi:hypothetical protein